MLLRQFSLGLALVATALASSLDDALQLYQTKRYPEARALLEKILEAEPRNAAAAHRLGLTLRYRGDVNALSDALVWLAKAVELEPTNPIFLGDFGGISLQFAARSRSLSAATKGRDAMIRAIELKPDYLDAREGLMQYYAQAPFLVGGSLPKAYAQAEEIRKRDPRRGVAAFVSLKISEKKYADATAFCEAALKTDPDNYFLLFLIGRIASFSGENAARGLSSLRRCLQLTAPPDTPSHADVQFRIGLVLEKQNDPAGARAAYESALKLDPHHPSATQALAKLK